VTEAAETGMNLIIDGLGASEPGAFARQLNAFAAAGYDVAVLLVDAPTEVCQQRNLERARHTGLLIDPHLLAAAHRDVSTRFHDWKDLPHLRFEMYATAE
ncbi:MAG: zeta toxin family protein, partial [Solirubrobacteraceae bacterium]